MSNSPMGQKDRPWRARISFQNGEASASITAGNACVLLSTDTSKVVSAATAGGTLAGGLFAGVASKTVTPGQYVDVIVSGYVPQLNMGTITRAASTNTWPSFAAFSAGDYFSVDTTGNGFARVGAAAGSSPYGYQIVCLSSGGNSTTQASSIGGTATSSLVSSPAWVRGLV